MTSAISPIPASTTIFSHAAASAQSNSDQSDGISGLVLHSFQNEVKYGSEKFDKIKAIGSKPESSLQDYMDMTVASQELTTRLALVGKIVSVAKSTFQEIIKQ